MSSIFPVVQPEAAETVSALPMAREVQWDFVAGVPVFSAGEPVIVTGAEAVKVWCWKALKTPRFRHEIYTHDYGCEAEDLIGQAFAESVKRSEVIRYIREAVSLSPYVTGVSQTDVDFMGSELSIQCTVGTIYGEVELNV